MARPPHQESIQLGRGHTSVSAQSAQTTLDSVRGPACFGFHLEFCKYCRGLPLIGCHQLCSGWLPLSMCTGRRDNLIRLSARRPLSRHINNTLHLAGRPWWQQQAGGCTRPSPPTAAADSKCALALTPPEHTCPARGSSRPCESQRQQSDLSVEFAGR